MRFQKRFLVSGLTAIMTLVLVFAGCSDDKSTTPTTTTGSLSDPEFIAVKAQIDAMADSTLDFFMHGLNALQGLDGADLPAQYVVDPGGNGSIETTYSNGWHIIGLSSLATGNSFWIRDSIQFLKDGTAQQLPHNAQTMSFIHRWHKNAAQSNSTDTASGRAGLSFGSFYQANTTVSGTAEAGYYNQTVYSDSTVKRSYDLDVTLTGFKIGESGLPGSTSEPANASNCPCQGTIEADVTSTYQKGSAAATVTDWEIEATFSNGTLSVEVTNNNTVWTYTRNMCTPPASN